LEKKLLKVTEELDILLKFKTIKTKLLFYFSTIVTAILVSFSIAFYYYFNKTITESIKTTLFNTAYEIEEKIESKQPINLEKYNLNIAIFKNNKLIAKNSDINFHINTPFFIKDYGEYLDAGIMLKFKIPFEGEIIVIKKHIDDKSEDIVDTMLVLEPILLFLLIFLASKTIDKILIPIKNITKISKEISINNFQNTIPQNEEYELKELIDSFNKMIQRLQSEVESLDRFNTNISHELKTPITIIKGEIAIALKKLRSPKYYQTTLISISQETDNIQKITDNLLLLTKYTKSNIDETFENCDLDSILLEVIEKYKTILKEKNINIEFKKFQNIKYRCNSQLIYHLFSNLIDNGIKYSPSNSTIHISLYKNKNIYFIIQDEGIGIDKNEIPKITEEFYQVNKSKKGFGLGLSIVKYAVELHNGKLKITSSHKGTIITITL